MPDYLLKSRAYHALKNEADTHLLPASKEAYERSALIVDQMKPEDVQPITQTENMSTVAFCDRFICKNCDIHLENWVKVVIDPDDGERYHYEYEFKFCPECGAKIVEEG